MSVARAKMQVASVTDNSTEQYTAVEVNMHAVCGNQPFGPNGESEDNSFARWTPSGNLKLMITNPNLRHAFKPGGKYYIDISEAAS